MSDSQVPAAPAGAAVPRYQMYGRIDAFIGHHRVLAGAFPEIEWVRAADHDAALRQAEYEHAEFSTEACEELNEIQAKLNAAESALTAAHQRIAALEQELKDSQTRVDGRRLSPLGDLSQRAAGDK